MSQHTSAPKIIAFYLPQFHPVKENDQWWGKGFTEWSNVSRAKALFPGHKQPKLPSELGFYDLRLPEVARQQAELAREYGVYGFCYYYYWFAPGKQLLERPLNEMLASGSPDFPFCLCWANENWTRRWDGAEQEILMKQEYCDEFACEFIESLLPSFRDKRYIRVGNRPLLLVYDVRQLPNPVRSLALWRKFARDAGFEDLYIVRCNTFIDYGEENGPQEQGFDACMDFPPHGFSSPELALVSGRENYAGQAQIFDYKSVVASSLNREAPPHKLFRGVMSGWDNTARKPLNPTIYFGSTPALYEYWLRAMIDWTIARHKNEEEQLVFVFAWNEWAEAAVLEPDVYSGRQYLEATRHALKPGSQCSFALLENLDASMLPASHKFVNGTVLRNGESLRESELIRGAISKLSIYESQIFIEGWASDGSQDTGDLQILVFENESLIGITNTSVCVLEKSAEMGIRAMRCGFNLQLKKTLRSIEHLHVCALNSALCFKKLQQSETRGAEIAEPSSFFSRYKTELLVLMHESRYGSQESVLLVGKNEKGASSRPYKIDLLLKNAQSHLAKPETILFLEFNSDSVNLSSLRDPELSIDFELPSQELLLTEVLQSLRLSEIEFLDKVRSEKQVTDITDRLSPYAEQNKATINSDPVRTFQNRTVQSNEAEFAELEAHDRVENPLVSICLPLRNAENSIGDTLKSVLGQSLKSLELLVIDDCSEDRTFEILMAFAAKDKRVIPWQNKSTIGRLACFNECLMRASGKYIKPLEQAVILLQDSLSVMVSQLEENFEQTLVSSLSKESISRKSLESSGAGKKTLKELLDSGIFSMKERIGSCSQLMFRTESIGRGFDSSLNNFAYIDYWLRILLKGDLYVLAKPCCRQEQKLSEWSLENKYYIEMSSELLDLKEIWRNNLERLDLDIEVLFDQALLFIAEKFAAYENRNGKNGVTCLDPEIVSQQRLQEMNISIMRTLGRCRYSSAHEIEAESRYILMLEEQLRCLLNTFSWKLTKPMREFKALLLSNKASEGADLANEEVQIDQQEYACYLRDLIRRVKTSRSWRLTAALRSIDGSARRFAKSRRFRNV